MAVACCASACAQTLNGTATITDADTIVIGGETIRLQGVDAPETDQICLDSRGAVWNCGIDARDRLIRHWIASDFLRYQWQRCFRSMARDLLHKRG
jgi:endonuclease YncB( thermonuclease family)